MKGTTTDTCPITHGTVAGDDIGVGNNHLRSALWKWNNANPIPKGATETDEGAQVYIKCPEQQIFDHVTMDDFRIGTNNSVRCPLHITLGITDHALQFHRTWNMKHLSNYTSKITTNMNCMVVE